MPIKCSNCKHLMKTETLQGESKLWASPTLEAMGRQVNSMQIRCPECGELGVKVYI